MNNNTQQNNQSEKNQPVKDQDFGRVGNNIRKDEPTAKNAGGMKNEPVENNAANQNKQNNAPEKSDSQSGRKTGSY